MSASSAKAAPLAPFGDYALLERVEPPDSVNGIYLPQEMERKLPAGRVLALGPQFESTLNTPTKQAEPSGIKVGDVVTYLSGQMLEFSDGRVYRMVRRDQISGVIWDVSTWRASKTGAPFSLAGPKQPKVLTPGDLAASAGN